jgi:2',3'-cyclic-nucleotide 2'-phosphodiesterase (5'-nucleotidase family)
MHGTRINRRTFLATSAGWLAACGTGVRANPENRKTISLIHTTDLHGHIAPTRTYSGTENVGGFARCATMIRRWRREHPDSLLLDIGDVWQGTPESHADGGAIMMRLFNRLGYDAWAPGNHDFDWGPAATRSNLALSKSQVLAANLRIAGKPTGSATGEWAAVKPWTLREVGGFRIALIGLITPGLPYWLAPETLGGVEATPPAEVLKRCITEARAAGADAIAVMAHMGWRNEDDFANPIRQMLREAPGADVLLAGHTHQDRPSWKTGPTLCTQASYHGIHCGRLDLTFDAHSRKLIACEAVTALMDPSIEADPAVMEEADPALRASAEQLARKLGTVTRTIPSAARDNQLATLFCELFAAALAKNKTPVDGVFHGTFGTGDLQPGDLTVGDCWKLLPYENLLLTARLGTADLIDIIRDERRVRNSDRILWPFDLKTNRAGDVTRFTRKGEEVKPDATFTIAFNSYDAQSGGQSMMRLRDMLQRPSAQRHLTAIDTRSALIDGVLERRSIP